MKGTLIAVFLFLFLIAGLAAIVASISIGSDTPREASQPSITPPTTDTRAEPPSRAPSDITKAVVATEGVEELPDYGQYPQKCVDLEDKYRDIAKCIQRDPDGADGCLAGTAAFTELQYCLDQYGLHSPVCSELDILKDMKEITACTEHLTHVLQQCREEAGANYLPLIQELQWCVSQHGIKSPQCNTSLVEPVEWLPYVADCLDRHGISDEGSELVWDLMDSFKVWERTVVGVFPTWDESAKHQYMILGAVGNCDNLIEVSNRYVDDMVLPLGNDDWNYEHLSDDEWYDLLADATMKWYGLHPSQYDDVRAYVQAYEEMLYVLDDVIVAQGCLDY